MKDEEQKINKNRRSFLRSSTLAAASSVVAGGLPGVATAATDEAPVEKKQEGYRLTKHIQDYYKSASS